MSNMNMFCDLSTIRSTQCYLISIFSLYYYYHYYDPIMILNITKVNTEYSVQ